MKPDLGTMSTNPGHVLLLSDVQRRVAVEKTVEISASTIQAETFGTSGMVEEAFQYCNQYPGYELDGT